MQEPAACAARPAQQGRVHIGPADTDATGTLTENSAHRSNAARIVLGNFNEKETTSPRIVRWILRAFSSGDYITRGALRQEFVESAL